MVERGSATQYGEKAEIGTSLPGALDSALRFPLAVAHTLGASAHTTHRDPAPFLPPVKRHVWVANVFPLPLASLASPAPSFPPF